ncbi:hypothetical protein CK203_006620 [Vitis vinifera]|uniref:Uncharacterized protein n=1 Tax=Vitis vinifera TaxID=29760 RepID=A0A438KAV3_VITVI|nr:hypothetical protein CK203_006620 [Vitis vinifera]
MRMQPGLLVLHIASIGTPTEEMGADSQGLPPCEPSPLAFVPVKGLASRRSRLARDLKSGLIGRLRIVSWKPSKSAARPSRMIIRRVVREMVEENPAAPGWSRMGVTWRDPAGENEGPRPGGGVASNASSGGSPVDDALASR